MYPILAFLLPLIIGFAIAQLAVPPSSHLALRVGLAILLGLLTSAGLASLNAVFWGSSRSALFAVFVAVMSVIGCFCYAQKVANSLPISPVRKRKHFSAGSVITGLALSYLIFRFGIVAVDGWKRPMAGADALWYWGYEAKRIFLEEAWTRPEGAGYLAPLNPALQLWVAQIMNRFDDVLVLMAWPLFLLASALLAFSFVQDANSQPNGRFVALATAYVAMSIPLVNVHAALGGYSDLLLSVLFFTALICAQKAINSDLDRTRWALLTLVFLLALPLTKAWGLALSLLLFFCGLFEIGITIQSGRFRKAAVFCAIGVFTLIVFSLVFGIRISHYSFSLEKIKPELSVLIESIWGADSFSILPLGLLILTVVWKSRLFDPKHRFSTLCLGALLVLILGAYSIDIGVARYDATAISRTFMIFAVSFAGFLGRVIASEVADEKAIKAFNGSKVRPS